MSTTVEQIVRGALLLISVINADETVPAKEGEDGLVVFNDMVASWAAHGVHVGAGASELDSPSPLEEQHTKGLKNLLAVELAAQFGRAIPDRVDNDAKVGWQLIQADFGVLKPLRADAALQNMPSQRRYC